MVRQRCTVVTVKFDDRAVADLYDELIDQGLPPNRFARIWIHTHPGDCPLPSSVDEATFTRVFGRTDWSVMAILARNDAAYARLAFHVGPGGSLTIPVRVDFGRPFAGSDESTWRRLYDTLVDVESLLPVPAERDSSADMFATDLLQDREGFDFDAFDSRSL